MQYANVYQQYKNQSLETLTKGEIVVKLFEEASKQVSTAIFLTNRGDMAKAYNCIAKAQKVITALENSLDMKYAISIELKDIYLFLFHKLGESISSRDTGLMKDLLFLIDELKVTFRQAERLSRIQK